MTALLLLCFLSCVLPTLSNPTFSKFFFMIYENHGYNQVVGHSGWKSIIDDGFLLTNYYSMLHASQPNYVAIMAGTYEGCYSESVVYLNYTNLIDLLEAKGYSWKSYNENYQPESDGGCSYSASGYYSRNHNPFMAFNSITKSSSRCQNVLNANQAYHDIKYNSLPHFSFYVPDNYNNSHDTALDVSYNYLSNFLNNWYYPYIDTTWKDTLLMISWDEDGKDEYNHVMSLFKHPCMQTGTSDTYYDHYSVTRFVIENFGLEYFGRNDTVSANFAKSFPMKCGGNAHHGGGGGGGGKTPTYEDDATWGEGDPTKMMGIHSRSGDILFMLCLALLCLVLPGLRLWRMSAKQHDKEEDYVLPTFVPATVASKLVTESNIPYDGGYSRF